MCRALLGFALNFVVFTSAYAYDFVGQEANYRLNSERSSWVIKTGTAHAYVSEYIPAAEKGPGYMVKVDYDLKVRFSGRKTGTVSIFVPEAVFTESFLSELKDAKFIDFNSFKISYVDTENIFDPNENITKECLVAKIEDIAPIKKIRAVTNTKIKVWMHNSIPVLKGLRLDVSGKNNGIDFVAGLDFIK